MERARELDPVSVSVNGDIGWYYYFARRFREAIEQCLKTLDLEPGHAGARSCLLSAHLLQGDLPAARVRARELMTLQGAPPAALAALDHGPGLDAYWRWTLERAWQERSGWLLPFLAVEPRLDPLRQDPRYAALLRRLRLPPGPPP
ncbi:MAG TPA: hypothetical protein VE685_18595 [Thermoanaerobaculia bacterium]|nr:hypothetical protein [Thermoanaerobaculia bacterium]